MSNSSPTAAPPSLQAALDGICGDVLNRCQGVLATLERHDRRHYNHEKTKRQLRKLELLLTAKDINDDPVTWTSLSNQLKRRPAEDWKVENLLKSHGVGFDSFRRRFKKLCDDQKEKEENVAENLVRRANGEVPQLIMNDAESAASTISLGSVVDKMKRLNLAGGNDATSVGSATATKMKILNKLSDMISNGGSIENDVAKDVSKTIKMLSEMQAMEFATTDQQDSFYRNLNEEILIDKELSLKVARDSRRAMISMARIQEEDGEE
eukprot:CAMPEP_0171334660 /NCGR_PEP_ID=MMETSP0878-20121228/4811_1 /TAXON_ID=67004 /ORGANISM="Thalassiosira weissflogii, Strain CCMP1336" /LENGTH=265 /DNA_ID=CAMNT_0011835789 /DNA_START=166 /DNA_END=963 /DNA_ORIENTATION=-